MSVNEYANLLIETVEVLKKYGLTPTAVRWVGTKDGAQSVSWNQFAKLADREYDSGYGTANVRSNLVVVGDTWWLERSEYDGSEWWAFKRLPMPSLTATRATGEPSLTLFKEDEEEG